MRLTEPRLAVPLLLVLALLLRLPNLLESFWLDEAVKSTHQVTASLRGLWWSITGPKEAPLYPVVMFFWVSVAGEHELMVRLPALMLGLGTIVLTCLIAKRFGAGNLLAGLILGFSPVHVWYSQEATQYTACMFFILCAVYVWPRVSALPFSWKAHAIYVIALLAASFTHYYAAVFLLPFTLLSLRAEKSMRRTIWLHHAVVVALLGFWLFLLLWRGMGTWQRFARPFTIFEWWMLFFQWFLHGNTLWTVSPYSATVNHLFANPLLLMVQLAALVLLVRGLWPDGRAESGLSLIELGLYLAVQPLAMLVLTMAGRDRMYIERYVVAGLPFFAIAIARGASSISLPSLRTAATAGLLVLGVISYGGLLRKDVQWTVYKHNPDWQSAAKVLKTRNGPAERMVVIGVVPLHDFAFYLRREMPVRQPLIESDDAEGFEPLVTSGRATQIVVVRNRAWSNDVEKVVDRYRQDARLRLAWHDTFKLVDLYTFVPASSALTANP